MRALPLLIPVVLLIACGDFDDFDRRRGTGGVDEDRRIIVNGNGTDPAPPVLDGGVVPPPAPAPDAGVPLAPDQGTTPPPPTGPTGLCGMQTLEEEVFKLVNQERAKGGLQPYKCTAEAVKVSRAYSKLMCDKKFFSHTGPGGTTPSKRFQAAGIAYASWVGENIAYGSSTAAGVMKMWMNSPGHRAAIMSNSFTHIGVGYEPCSGGGGGWFGGGQHYWTQDFYVPK